MYLSEFKSFAERFINPLLCVVLPIGLHHSRIYSMAGCEVGGENLYESIIQVDGEYKFEQRICMRVYKTRIMSAGSSRGFGWKWKKNLNQH